MSREVNHKKEQFAREVGAKSSRKKKARDEEKKGLWFGLGMFGLVGWSVAIPTLLLLGMGIWIDSTYKSRYSWTLMLMVAGMILGCLNAWYWVERESGKNE